MFRRKERYMRKKISKLESQYTDMRIDYYDLDKSVRSISKEINNLKSYMAANTKESDKIKTKILAMDTKIDSLSDTNNLMSLLTDLNGGQSLLKKVVAVHLNNVRDLAIKKVKGELPQTMGDDGNLYMELYMDLIQLITKELSKSEPEEHKNGDA